MLKRCLTVLLIISICAALCGCFCPKNNGVHSYTTDLPNISSYGLFETIAENDKYITATSFEISSSYETGDITTNGSGYFIIIGVDTNMVDDDFRPSSHSGVIFDPEGAKLNFVLLDRENGKLVYEIEENEKFDYSILKELKISDSKQNDFYIEIWMQPFKIKHNNAYYFNKIFRFNLELSEQ